MLFPGGAGVTDGRREGLAGAVGEMSFALSPSRKSRFHNFSFPTMSWGSQRLLRCVNPISRIGGLAAGSTLPETRFEPQKEKHTSSSLAGPFPMPPNVGGSKDKEGERDDASSAAAEEETAAAAKPWNLRTRRSACYAPSENGRNRYSCSSPSNPPTGKDDSGKAVMRKSVAAETEKRRELSVSLSREEIEEDFYAFKGSKPNRRPKKRPRIVQRQLDALFPGLWLSEVTIDVYKVVE